MDKKTSKNKVYLPLEKILLTAFFVGALATGIMYKTNVKEKYSKWAGISTIYLGAAFYISRLTRTYSNQKN